MKEHMDELKNNPEILGTFQRFLNSILSAERPLHHALAIFSRRFASTRSSAVSTAEEFKKHLSFGGFLGYGLSVFQRLYDLIVQALEAQAMKPVTLGRTPDFHAAESHDGTITRNDRNLVSISHKNPSEERDYCLMNAAKHRELVEYNLSFPGYERRVSGDDEVQSRSSTLRGKDGGKREKYQKFTVPIS